MATDLDVFSFIEHEYPEAATVARAILNDSNGIMTRDALVDMIGKDMSLKHIIKGLIDLGPMVEVAPTGDEKIGPVVIFHLERMMPARVYCKKDKEIGRWIKSFGLKVAGRSWQIQPKRKEGTAQKLKRLQPSTQQGTQKRGRPPKAATSASAVCSKQIPATKSPEDM